MFVLDGSGSVSRRQFESMLGWVSQVTETLRQKFASNLRVGIIQYSG